MALTEHFWTDRTVLVTGGSSFIAASLVRQLLALGAQLHVLVRPTSSLWRLQDGIEQIKVYRGDVSDPVGFLELLGKVEPEVIFHLATAKGASSGSMEYVSTAVLGAVNLVEGLKKMQCNPRLVVAGSSMEYAPSDAPVIESYPIQPVTLNGAVKAAAGILYRQAAESCGLWVTQLRLFHVYGPWESPHRFLPTAIRNALDGVSTPLTAGESRRDWIYVDDVIDAMLRAATVETRHRVINVGSGVEHTNIEVLGILQDLLESELSWQLDALPSRKTDSAHRVADIGLARKALGWSPRFSLREGIASTIDWYRKSPEILQQLGEAPPTAI